jgi:vesicle coat complex subunit
MASPKPSLEPSSDLYFEDQKKGEVNELRVQLKGLSSEKDVKAKRETIKRAIALMTQGVDVSRLFAEMVMAMETKDMVIKKMVYLYLTSYASKNPELAIMCINTLRRDCDDEDPVVRGLALRSLCSLRLDSLSEYVELPLKNSLTDSSAYVRKTGVMGLLKLFSSIPQLAGDPRLVDEQLTSLMRDPDPHVAVNALFALSEIKNSGTGAMKNSKKDGNPPFPNNTNTGFSISEEQLLHLLGNMGEMSEWELAVVFELLAKYTPKEESAVFALMNLLDPVFRSASSSAFLASVKCFLSLCQSLGPDTLKVRTLISPNRSQIPKPPTLIINSFPLSATVIVIILSPYLVLPFLFHLYCPPRRCWSV